ncbi:MAG: hypothetical protein ABIP76_05635, partial [Verrucomicrobiota bacterium]
MKSACSFKAMSDLETIQTAVRRAAQRLRWQRALRGVCYGLFAGASLWLLALGCYKIFPIPFEIVLGTAIIAIPLLAIGFIHGWTRPMSLLETARWIDERQKLQERLSTALEMASLPTSGNWKDLLLSDAAGHARALDPRRLIPTRLPKVSRWALLILALSAGLGFIPEYRSKAFVQKQNEKAIIKEVGKQIGDLTRKNLAQHPPALEKTKDSLESIEELGNQFAKTPLTRGQALKDLASATDKLKSDMKELGRNPALKPLERAARETARAGGNVPGEVQKQIDSLQKALGEKGSDPDALEKMKSELQKAQQAASGMAGKNSAEAAAAKQQLAQALANLAQQAREMGLPMESLDEAIAALQANQTDMFLKDLNAAVNDLEKLQQMAKSLQQLQQQAGSKVGKDLAEQLKNGQAEAAQKTLEEMVAQLKQSNLSPDQISKLLDEVAKAVDPAGEYGKVKDLLKSAVDQMKKGEKSDAAASLADAAKELEKLLQQMSDAESLKGTLEALQKASMCVGNGQSWAQCKSPGKGSGKGGKAGSGVGTWADENGWLYYPEITERWDNSGAIRPDVAPRGLSDRGEGELADTLAPTKIRGQMNPGGSMPSITLKGVSIKGQSKVGYQEAVNAAQ